MFSKVAQLSGSVSELAKATRRIVSGAALTLCLVTGMPTVSHAQDLFAPVMKVNDRIISAYEYSQRIAFLTILRAPGDIQKTALEQLTNEALQRHAAELAGVTATPEEILVGMNEFTARFEMDVETFTKIIAQGGVAPETFRDFVSAGLIWRSTLRQKWQGKINITEEEIDRRIAQTGLQASIRVLLSEIILPATNPTQAQIANQRAAELGDITTLAPFAAAARSNSVAPSRGRSGRLNWMELSNLPPAIQARILALEPGHVTDPIPVKNGIAVFQLRALEESQAPTPKDVIVDYATLMIPGGRSTVALEQAAAIKAKSDTCDDLYGTAAHFPASALQRHEQNIGALSNRYGIELAKLDDGEVSTALTSENGANLVFLMLCERTRELPEDVSRDDILLRLQNQRLQSYATAYLAELTSNAHIVDYRGQ